jgi:hypothetical protein
MNENTLKYVPQVYGWHQYRSHNLIGEFAIFNEALRDLLPSEGQHDDDGFDADILDLHTGKVYRAKQKYVAYDDENYGMNRYVSLIPDDAHYSLHDFYSYHWCACHRHGDMIDGDDIRMEGEHDCPKDRFMVLKLWYHKCPEFVLFYERLA